MNQGWLFALSGNGNYREGALSAVPPLHSLCDDNITGSTSHLSVARLGCGHSKPSLPQMLWQVWPNDAVVEQGLMIQAEPGERRTQENLVGRESRWDHKAMTKFEGSQSVGGRRASKRSFSEADLIPVVNHKTYMSFLFWRL